MILQHGKSSTLNAQVNFLKMSNKQNFVSSVVKHVQTLVPLQSIVDKLNINVKKQVKTQVNRENFAPIVFIAVEDLVVDKKYQRYINESFIKKARRKGGFKPDLTRPLIIAKRPEKLGGQNVIVDGQHTGCLATVYLTGDGTQEVPCQIPSVLQHPEDRSLAECERVESEFFDDTNYLRNNPNAIARLRAGVSSGNVKALAWEETFASIGVNVEKIGAPEGHEVYGLSKLQAAINKYGVTYTKQAVELYANTIKYSTSDAWKHPLQGPLILGLAAAYHFVDNYAGNGDTKKGFINFLENHLLSKNPKEWTEKTSGVIMDQLILEDKLVVHYNAAVSFGVIQAPKIGPVRVESWKADPIHGKTKDEDEEES